MKVFSSTSEFNYSWDEVSTGNWQKYSPWNENCSHVIAVDTISRTVDEATGILRTERIITCQQAIPKWLQPIMRGADSSIVYETSYVDPRSKKVTMCSMNLTWSDILSVRETVIYSPSLTTPSKKTQMIQHAEITAVCGGWKTIKNKIEMFSVERFQQNADKGRAGFEMVLAKAREAFQEERQQMSAHNRQLA